MQRIAWWGVALVAFALGGCSNGSSTGSSTSSSASSSGGTDASSSSSSSSSSSTSSTSSSTSSSSSSTSGGDPIQQCISACEAQHPQGVQLGKGIDSCWSASCKTECNDIGTGKNELPDHGSCKNVVSTPSKVCSQCTVDHCCAAWDACFDNADCSALNACSIACYK